MIEFPDFPDLSLDPLSFLRDFEFLTFHSLIHVIERLLLMFKVFVLLLHCGLVLIQEFPHVI